MRTYNMGTHAHPSKAKELGLRGNLLKECKCFLFFNGSTTLSRWQFSKPFALQSGTQDFLSHLYLWWLGFWSLPSNLLSCLQISVLLIFMNPKIRGSGWTGECPCMLSLGLGILVVLWRTQWFSLCSRGGGTIAMSWDLGLFLQFVWERSPQTHVSKWAYLRD